MNILINVRLDGLTPAPAQVWGNVRLVPLLRDRPVEDLRMALRDYREQLLAVTRLDKRTQYLSYVPHGLVMQWNSDGEPLAAVDTRLGAKDVRRDGAVVRLTRVARGLGRGALRLLPLHLAMEGYLALHFGGPDLAQSFWSRQALRDGMSPRQESSVSGDRIPGLDEALRLFERHHNQCGMLVFIGDQLASATIVGHPEDYAALHGSLITDFYGKLFAQFGWAFRDVENFDVTLSGTTVAEIRASLVAAREDWAEFATSMAAGLFPREVTAERVRKAGRFRLVRFATGFDHAASKRDGEHIGEALIDDSGALVYLKTYRLDRGQVRRGYLLSGLAKAGWDAERFAAEQGHGSLKRVVADLDSAGLAWMVRRDWRDRLLKSP